VVPQQTAWVIETFGKYDKVLQPGLRFLIPFVQRISYVFSLKEEAISVPSQTAITRDNVSVSIDGVLFVKVSELFVRDVVVWTKLCHFIAQRNKGMVMRFHVSNR